MKITRAQLLRLRIAQSKISRVWIELGIEKDRRLASLLSLGLDGIDEVMTELGDTGELPPAELPELPVPEFSGFPLYPPQVAG